MPVFQVDVVQACHIWENNRTAICPNSLLISNSWIDAPRTVIVEVKYASTSVVNASAQLVPVEGYRDDQVFLSPEFLMNSLPEFLALPRKIALSIDLIEQGESTVPDYPTADVITVAVIKSTTYPSDYDYTDSLTEYFSDSLSLVKIDNFISIPLSVYDRTIILQQYPCANLSSKCINIKLISANVQSDKDVTFFYIDMKLTTMYQKGICKERIWRLSDFKATDFLSSSDKFLSETVRTLQNSLLDPSASLPFIALKGKKGSGRRYLSSSLAKRLGYNMCTITAYDLYSSTVATIEEKLKQALRIVIDCEPCIVCFENIDRLLAKNVYGNFDERLVTSLADQLEEVLIGEKRKFIFVATLSENLPFPIERLVIKDYNIGRLSSEERRMILEDTFLSESNVYQIEYSEADIDYLVRQTGVYLAGDLVNIVHKIISSFDLRAQSESSKSTKQDIFDEALKSVFKERDDNYNVQTIQKTRWEDIGGLADIVNEVQQTIQLATESVNFLPEGLRINSTGGILFYGPPGTGKTLLAKAVATECSLNFISVKGPELVNMYVGKSEENVRELFSRLRSAAPCILFCDELDSLAPRRGWSADSGGVMDRLVAQLATEMDSLSQQSDTLGIVLIGATNRPDLIDPALLRPGRFDRMFYVGGNTDRAAQQDVLSSLTRRFPLEDSTADQLKDVVNKLPERITGADIYALSTMALQKAFRRIILNRENENVHSDDNAIPLLITLKDFEEAASELLISVTEKEFEKYDEMKKYFSG